MTVDLYKNVDFLKLRGEVKDRAKQKTAEAAAFYRVCYYACTCRSSGAGVVCYTSPKRLLKPPPDCFPCDVFLPPHKFNSSKRPWSHEWERKTTNRLVGDCQRPRGRVTFLAVRFWGVQEERVQDWKRRMPTKSQLCFDICLFVELSVYLFFANCLYIFFLDPWFSLI